MQPTLHSPLDDEFPLLAVTLCGETSHRQDQKTTGQEGEQQGGHEEGDPPDAHQHIDPLPFDYNLDRHDMIGRHIIRHNFH